MALADFYRGCAAAQERLPVAGCDPGALAAAAAAALDELLAAAPAAGAACGPGCACCCSFPVGVTIAEALALRQAVLAHPDRAALVARVAADAAAVADLAWADLAAALRPCPLLTAERRCSVHPHRPLPCRAFRSRERAACERAFAAGGAAPPPATDAGGLHQGLGAQDALGHALARHGLPANSRELRSALAALLALPPDAGLPDLAAAFAAGPAEPR